MLEVGPNQLATLEVTFIDNGVSFDPIHIDPIVIRDPLGSPVATLAPQRAAPGRFFVQYFVPGGSLAGTWSHDWTWQASGAVNSITQRYNFTVLGTTQVGLITANFVGFGACKDGIWSEGSDSTVITLKNVPKRAKIFISKDGQPYDPGVVSLNVADDGGNTVYTASLLEGQVKREAIGVYYVDLPSVYPPQNLFSSAPKRYMLQWSYGVDAGSEQFIAISWLWVLNHTVYQWFPRLRLQMDKAVKIADKSNIGYTDAELFYYLQGGMDEVNMFPPVTNFMLDNWPETFGQLLINSATVVGMVSQKLFAVDTDVMPYSDQGFQYTLDHFTRLNTVLAELLAHIQDQMTKFKWEFSQLGSVTVQVVPYFPMAVLLKTSPRGSLFRNLFVSQ